jgi:hypothetical protein
MGFPLKDRQVRKDEEIAYRCHQVHRISTKFPRTMFKKIEIENMACGVCDPSEQQRKVLSTEVTLLENEEVVYRQQNV